MNRKTALIVMLLIYLSAGSVAGIFLHAPAAQTVSMKNTVSENVPASLAPPKKEDTGETEEKKEAVLPALPALPSKPAPDDDYEPHYRYRASHSSQRLFIRNGASLQAKIIGALQPGDTGEVIRIEEAWVYLKHNRIEGYVFKEYLTLTEIPRSEDLPES